MSIYYQDAEKMLVAVDCIVFGFEAGKLKLLLGRRSVEPGRGEWSLYGGFVRTNESPEAAADRVLHTLTGLKQIYMRQVGAFGEVARDPGQRVISIAYFALINVKDYDDNLRKAYKQEWISIDNLPPLFSDHHQMVMKALQMMQKGLSTEPICFNLLPPLFTLTQLQTVYEAILGEEIDKRNFRKRIKSIDIIQKTDKIDKLSSKRGAALYRFDQQLYNKAPFLKL